MNLVETFAGIGGFALGFGVRPEAWVEIDPACQELLLKAYPGAPWAADIKEAKFSGDIDVLTGGFPCQDISIAGPRHGLKGDRSGLFWEFVRILEECRPRWFVLENVTGLLSSGGRRDMGAILGALVDRGYCVGYRVLDAQHFGVPQRRRRVFIVGRLGTDRDGPAEVLALRESLHGYLGARGKKRSRATGAARASVEEDRGDVNPSYSLRLGQDGANGIGINEEVATTHVSWRPNGVAQPIVQPILMRNREGKPGGGKGPLLSEDASLTIATANDQTLFQPVHVVQPFDESYGYVVRRLTPVECERLQGFPDGWTEGFPDTVRYRMLGNAVCVPVVRWIADRMRQYDERRS